MDIILSHTVLETGYDSDSNETAVYVRCVSCGRFTLVPGSQENRGTATLADAYAAARHQCPGESQILTDKLNALAGTPVATSDAPVFSVTGGAYPLAPDGRGPQ